jgi:pimeloyl-ACP methyl ester carboxylesterase
MWSLLLIPLFLYLSILALVFAFQGRMLFPAGAAGGTLALRPGAERIAAETADGNRLHGVRIPAARSGARPATLILGFGGNGWNAEAAAAYLADTFPEADVVVFHYRGYRPSTGSPGASALIEDAARVYDAAAAPVPGARVVAVGFSIGSGVAATLAARRRLDGLILVTPFDSLGKVAAGHYRWLPVRRLFRHEIDAAGALRSVRVPVAIVAAARDTLIPAARTQGLRRMVPNLVFDRTIAGAGHNDIYDRGEFRTALRDALRAVRAR